MDDDYVLPVTLEPFEVDPIQQEYDDLIAEMKIKYNIDPSVFRKYMAHKQTCSVYDIMHNVNYMPPHLMDKEKMKTRILELKVKDAEFAAIKPTRDRVYVDAMSGVAKCKFGKSYPLGEWQKALVISEYCSFIRELYAMRAELLQLSDPALIPVDEVLFHKDMQRYITRITEINLFRKLGL